MRFVTLIIIFVLGSAVAAEEKQMKKLPIVYREEYNITLGGIEKLHAFDSEKYGKVFKHLVEKVGIKEEQFYKPELVSDEDLLLVHSKRYLESLKKSKNIARIIELDLLKRIPNSMLQSSILKPMKYATGGTVLASELALKEGWAINLSGGYHHAKANKGSGFSFYADVPIALKKLWEKKPRLKVLIVDLDAHQGNGFEAILKDDPRVCILDVYNADNYPYDEAVKKYIDYKVELRPKTRDNAYLKKVRVNLEKAMKVFKPELVVYNAGTDIYEEDPLGGLMISEKGIIERDSLVFKYSLENDVPIMMVLSGGYHKKSAAIISKSIEDLLINVIRIERTAPISKSGNGIH